MTAFRSIVTKAFPRNKGILRGTPSVIEGAGSPDTSVTAKHGTLYWDVTNSDAYINEDGSTNWIKINA